MIFFSLATPRLRLSGIVINWKCDVRVEFVKSSKSFLSESVFSPKNCLPKIESVKNREKKSTVEKNFIKFQCLEIIL